MSTAWRCPSGCPIGDGYLFEHLAKWHDMGLNPKLESVSHADRVGWYVSLDNTSYEHNLIPHRRPIVRFVTEVTTSPQEAIRAALRFFHESL